MSCRRRYTRTLATLRVLLAVLAVAAGLATARGAEQQPQQQPSDMAVETPWPQEIVSGDLTLRVYQPQLDSWDGSLLKARAAVSLQEGKEGAPTYGIVYAQARTLVDKQQRIVTLDDFDVLRTDLPSASDRATEATQLIETENARKHRTIALDRLEAALEINAAESTVSTPAVHNDPPHLLFSTTPAMLIYIDGKPSYRAVASTHYERVVNTRPLVVRDESGTHFLKVFDGWMTANALQGPWSVAVQPPQDLEAVLKVAVDSRQVDLLTGQADPEQAAPSLKTSAPTIYVAMEPTELVVTDGEPKWTPIAGTKLLYAENTTGHLFKLVTDQKTYVLVSGRWFRAPSTSGPWEFIAANELPKDFASIPDDSPKENVKASVANTPQAKEAAIAATIPETAAVDKSAAKLSPPKFDGDPKLQPIDGTPLQYVTNSATPIIRVNANAFYAVENAVWFTGRSVHGPWAVATSVPAVIYTIPSSSPLHYVTYVKIYNVEGNTVYVGYTPGYQGEYVDPVTHVVVYGTGYYYTPWVGTVWYGPPVTYGFGVAMCYTPWTGWAVGFGFGWAWGAATVATGWGWGPYPWWGAYGWGWSWGPAMYPVYPVPYWHGGAAVGPRGAMAWGPGGWVGTTGNMYRRWGSTVSVSRASGGYNAWTGNAWASNAGRAYNSRTGTLAAGQRGATANVYTGRYAEGARGAATNARTGVTGATRQGTVGNARTGQEISGGQSAIYDPRTGTGTTAGHISGEHGTIGRVGDDYYAGYDGNVYRHGDDGWQQMEREQRVESRPEVQQQLDRDLSARSSGAERYASRQSSARSMSRGGGRRR